MKNTLYRICIGANFMSAGTNLAVAVIAHDSLSLLITLLTFSVGFYFVTLVEVKNEA